METHMIFGAVSADGNKTSGIGFEASRSGPGNYRVDFDQSYNNTPTVVATLIGNASGGRQADNVINVDPNQRGCQIHVFDLPDGNGQDGAFNFIATGI